ncbi:hypothetical protein [Streptomyces halobius]|uniref:Uncharacterized protein n=1 Tax=Streptomyces halobius TaxID=2879846 RepID=A0ABY4M1W1_9ACTN|nr:hypothetical protein [Streptomyces halobius]UQA91746.1 hypothetical protein K9S39_07585 [Streptomyces halobius]
MRIRTTLSAVTLATAALLGGAGIAAADHSPGFSSSGTGFGSGSGTGFGEDVSGSSVGKGSQGPGGEAGTGSDSSSSPKGLLGTLMGG